MEDDTNITAQDVLGARRARFKFEIPPYALAIIASPDAKQISEAARKRFDKACDAGIGKRLADAILEPANPFDAKTPRRMRQEAIVLGSLIGFAAALTIFFNICAHAR